MMYPVNYIAITKPFNIKTKDDDLYHTGIDLGFYSQAHKYQPIYSPAEGEVIYKKIQKTGGLTIHVRHKGCVSCFGNLDSWVVNLGDKIKAGQKIGTMGASGKVTGMHLHYGLCLGDTITYTKKDKWVDPCLCLCVFDGQKVKNNLKTRLRVKHYSKKATTDLWVHKPKNYAKTSRIYVLKKNEETAYYGKDGSFAIVDNINGYYCSKKYLK